MTLDDISTMAEGATKGMRSILPYFYTRAEVEILTYARTQTDPSPSKAPSTRYCIVTPRRK